MDGLWKGVRWRALGLATVLVAAMAGCSTTTTVNQSEQSYQVGSITTLKINAHSATVNIVTAPGATTVKETLRYTGSLPATTHSVNGPILQLTETGCTGANLRCDVQYQISVAAPTAAQITTQAGKVTVHGLAGALDVNSDAASVTGDGLASTTTTVTTKAGFVKLAYQNAPTELTVSTSAGAIELKVPGGLSYAVKVTKNLGVDNVKVRQDAASPRKISAHTDVGAVTINPN